MKILPLDEVIVLQVFPQNPFFCGFVVCIKELKILQEHKNITLKKPQDQ